MEGDLPVPVEAVLAVDRFRQPTGAEWLERRRPRPDETSGEDP